MRRLAAVAAALLLAAPGAAGGGEGDFPAPGAGDKCSVCGMFVKRYPDWIGGVRLRDGSHLFFDGAKDLFKWWLRPDRYSPGRTPGDVEAIFVTDYYAVRRIPAREAWFVLGSDVLGPMGHELVPFADEREAREFLKDHHGRRVVRFADVTPALLKELQ